MENALIENEALYRNLFENAAIGMFQSSLEGRFMRINKAFATMLVMNHRGGYFEHHRYGHTDPRGSQKPCRTPFRFEKAGWFYAEQPYFRKDGSIMTGKFQYAGCSF